MQRSITGSWKGLSKQVQVKQEPGPLLTPKSGVLTPNLSDVPGDSMGQEGQKNLGFE